MQADAYARSNRLYDAVAGKAQSSRRRAGRTRKNEPLSGASINRKTSSFLCSWCQCHPLERGVT
jgi:hypothetical protein